MFVERPIGEAHRGAHRRRHLRGIVLTDALIGTFTHAHDLLANRCFLYHVVGRGTGHWDIPVGGMGTVSAQLAAAAEKRGAELVTDTEVVAVAHRRRAGRGDDRRRSDDRRPPGVRQRRARRAAPAARRADRGPAPEGAQVKVNMLLSRLPRLRDPDVRPEQAFAGTFHVNEGYAQLETAYRQAAAGRIPDSAPCEVYCHSLADPSILSAELQAAGAQTLTVFALHMPARLFRDDPAGALAEAEAAVLASLDSVLAEPIEECLLDPDVHRGDGSAGDRGRPRHARRAHLPPRPAVALRRDGVRGGPLGRRDRARQRVRLRRRRPPRRRRLRHPRPQRRHGRPGRDRTRQVSEGEEGLGGGGEVGVPRGGVAGLGDREDDELGRADVDEALDRVDQGVPADRHERRRVVEIGTAPGELGQQDVGHDVERVGDQHAEVVLLDRPVVLGGDLLDHRPPGGGVGRG